MPIQIMEMVVRASINKEKKQNDTSSGKAKKPCNCKKEAKEAVTDQLQSILNRKKER